MTIPKDCQEKGKKVLKAQGHKRMITYTVIYSHYKAAKILYKMKLINENK